MEPMRLRRLLFLCVLKNEDYLIAIYRGNFAIFSIYKYVFACKNRVKIESKPVKGDFFKDF